MRWNMVGKYAVGAAFLIVAALQLGGCQTQTKSATTPAATSDATQPAPMPQAAVMPSGGAGLGKEMTGVFDTRIENATKAMFSNISMSCVRESSGGVASPDLMSCFSAKVAKAIEPSGAANKYCDRGPDIEASFKCTLLGAMLMNLRAKAQAPVSPEAWQDLEAVLAGEATAAAFDESFSCAKTGRSGTLEERACLAERLTPRLGGDPEDGSLCLALQDDLKFGQCLGEAAILVLIESAVTRTGS